MTLNGAIMELVMLSENSMMPVMFKSIIRKIIETVSKCEEPERPTGWIPCSERLPEDYEDVLVSGEKIVKQAQFIKGTFETEDGEGYATIDSNNIYEPNFYTFKAIAWMPLPKPYCGA